MPLGGQIKDFMGLIGWPIGILAKHNSGAGDDEDERVARARRRRDGSRQHDEFASPHRVMREDVGVSVGCQTALRV
jgi:hypothetical protein